MFLFAVGYGVGPQFVRGIATGRPAAGDLLGDACACSAWSPASVIAKIAGYDLGYAAGLYSGSQTISAAMGLSTDAINRLGMSAEETKALIDSMPIAYAVTYMFGTMGSAVVIAIVGPKLLGIDLVAACKDYEEKHGGSKKELGGAGSAWHRWVLRAYKVRQGGKAAGLRAAEAESLVPDARLFIQRLRRDGQIIDATADTVLQGGRRGRDRGRARSAGQGAAGGGGSRRPGAAGVPVEGVDVLVTNKEVDGKTLAELAQSPQRARRVPAQDHARRDRHRHPDPAEHRESIAATCSPWSAARRTSPPPPRCSASRTARPTSPTWRSSARSSWSAR